MGLICCPMCKIEPLAGQVLFQSVEQHGFQVKQHYWEKITTATVLFDDDTRLQMQPARNRKLSNLSGAQRNENHPLSLLHSSKALSQSSNEQG